MARLVLRRRSRKKKRRNDASGIYIGFVLKTSIPLVVPRYNQWSCKTTKDDLDSEKNGCVAGRDVSNFSIATLETRRTRHITRAKNRRSGKNSDFVDIEL